MSNDAPMPTTVLDAVIGSLDDVNEETLTGELIATGIAMICGACESEDDAFRRSVLDMLRDALLPGAAPGETIQ